MASMSYNQYWSADQLRNNPLACQPRPGGEILSQVANHRDRFLNKKAGIPTAILLSIQDYEDLENLIEIALEQLDPVALALH